MTVPKERPEPSYATIPGHEWDWGKIGPVIILVAWLTAMVVIILSQATKPDLATVSCDYFANYTLNQMPARCIEYWTGKR